MSIAFWCGAPHRVVTERESVVTERESVVTERESVAAAYAEWHLGSVGFRLGKMLDYEA